MIWLVVCYSSHKHKQINTQSSSFQQQKSHFSFHFSHHLTLSSGLKTNMSFNNEIQDEEVVGENKDEKGGGELFS